MRQETVATLVTINTIILVAFLIGAILLYFQLRPAIKLTRSLVEPAQNITGRVRRGLDSLDQITEQASTELGQFRQRGIQGLDQLGQRILGNQ